VAGNTRKEIEAKTGKKIVSPLNAKALKPNQDKGNFINQKISSYE